MPRNSDGHLGAVRAVLTAPLDVPLAPLLLPWLYRALVAGAIICGAILTVLTVVESWWLGLVVVPTATVLVVMVLRVGCELALGITRIPQMSLGLSRMEDAVADIGVDMPRLGFLRRPSAERANGDEDR